MKVHLTSLVLALGLVAAGCSPLAPRPDYTRYYVLTPLAGDAVPATRVSQQLAIGLGPIDFPNYLRRAQVVTRTGPNQLDLSAEARWAEPLDKDFERILTENLARALGTERIEKYPWNPRLQLDYQIVIFVQRFETSSDGQAQLVARWIIKDGQGTDIYASATTATSPVASNDAGGAAALSSDLGQLSSAIAAQVTQLSRNRPTPIS